MPAGCSARACLPQCRQPCRKRLGIARFEPLPEIGIDGLPSPLQRGSYRFPGFGLPPPAGAARGLVCGCCGETRGDIVAQESFLKRRLLLQIHEPVGRDMRRERSAALLGLRDRSRVGAGDPPPVGQRRINARQLPFAERQYFLAGDDPYDFGTAHVRSPSARVIARRSRARSLSGSSNQRCDETR